jgi:hypothetical protein
MERLATCCGSIGDAVALVRLLTNQLVDRKCGVSSLQNQSRNVRVGGFSRFPAIMAPIGALVDNILRRLAPKSKQERTRSLISLDFG